MGRNAPALNVSPPPGHQVSAHGGEFRGSDARPCEWAAGRLLPPRHWSGITLGAAAEPVRRPPCSASGAHREDSIPGATRDHRIEQEPELADWHLRRRQISASRGPGRWCRCVAARCPSGRAPLSRAVEAATIQCHRPRRTRPPSLPPEPLEQRERLDRPDHRNPGIAFTAVDQLHTRRTSLLRASDLDASKWNSRRHAHGASAAPSLPFGVWASVDLKALVATGRGRSAGPSRAPA